MIGKDDALLSDKETEIKEKLQHEVNGVEHSHTSIDPLSKPDIDTRTSQAEISDGTRQSRKRWQKLFTSCITLHRGWNIYRNYEIVFAGLSLASLYLTVLSFHYITTGKWAIYRNYEIVFSGLSLASLYLTVLSLHYITTGKWAIYRNYEIVFCGLSLASLYRTVLTFHYITTGKWVIYRNSEIVIAGLSLASLNLTVLSFLYITLVSGLFIENTKKSLLASVSPRCTSQCSASITSQLVSRLSEP